MKRILVCLLALLLVLTSVAAFAEEYDPSDKYLGIVCYPSSNTTIAVWMTGFLQTAEELGYQPLYIGGDTTDAAAVEQMIDSVIAQYDNLAGVAIPINGETRVVMEHTGRYYESIEKVLHEKGLFVSSVTAGVSRKSGSSPSCLTVYLCVSGPSTPSLLIALK